MPDSKRPSGPGKPQQEQRDAATTQEEIDETILERSGGSDAARSLDVPRDAGRGERNANVDVPSKQPASERDGSDKPERS